MKRWSVPLLLLLLLRVMPGRAEAPAITIDATTPAGKVSLLRTDDVTSRLALGLVR